MTVSSHDLRLKFLDFFRRQQHVIEKSAPLIPKDDPTLLFVNAGMVPFKNVFTQREIRPYKRAASSQKCVRAGGKHNDLENVGHTARHHTFFEMLGNFSFGDYFKEEAIALAWRFLTEELGLDKSRLSVSVFAGDELVPPDSEAKRIWHELIGLPPEKITLLGREDNFWQMGETGPCGPCSEIHFDRGDIDIGFGNRDPGDRVIEIWNLVFMQYEMLPDKTLLLLPKPCVDTGMGLERLASVINGLPSNYDTDLLRPLIAKAEYLSRKTYRGSDAADDIAMRVVADHARACAFLIADGLFPGNEGRAYVLRRFMRRAIRHGALLGLSEPFFYRICLEVIEVMKGAYPELADAKEIIEKVSLQEEKTFRKTLERGLELFEIQTKGLQKGDRLSGETVFHLYETFGFPPDLTEDLAKERNLLIDWEEFDRAKAAHEEKSAKGLGLKGIDEIYLNLQKRLPTTVFFDISELADLEVIALLQGNDEVDRLEHGQQGVVLLNKTPFYGESGGQVGDSGCFTNGELYARVIDTKKSAGLHLHEVQIEGGEIRRGQFITGKVDWTRRQAIRRNHSATHLLHSALREVLGTHVIQKGSLVAWDRLRFDFSHFEAMTAIQLARVEDLVNEWILANEKAKTQLMSMEEAKTYGALALFGEKYEAKVRVLNMGSHSTELCGGTHCHRTGDIGCFKIISEGPLAQGIRRIEAITGFEVLSVARKQESLLKSASLKLGIRPEDLEKRIEQLMAEAKLANTVLRSKTAQSLKEHAELAANRAKSIGSIKFVAEICDFIDNHTDMKTYADLIRDRLKSGLVALGHKQADKCLLLIAATKDLGDRISAGKLIAQAAPIIGGKGGGRADFAQAGGQNHENLGKALAAIEKALQDSVG